jgi:phytoene synthase
MSAAGEQIFTTEALNECLLEVKKFDRERYLTAIMAPRAERFHLLALYAFNLELSRIPVRVSEPMLGQIRLQWWRDVLERVRAGGEAPHALAAALAAAMAEGTVEMETLSALIDGRERDLDKTPFNTQADLEAYLSGTSGVLMHAAAKVSAEPHLPDVAARLGIAYGLAGLIRALPYQAQHGYVALPTDLLRGHGLTGDDLLRRRHPDSVRAATAELAASGLELLRSLREVTVADVGLPALLHGELAKYHLAKAQAASYDPYDPPPSGDGVAVLRLQWRAWRRKF